MDTPEIKSQNPEIKPEAKCKCRLWGCKCRSKAFKSITAAVGLFLVILASFAGGVKIGTHKAKFSCDWGKNYERNFMGSKNGMASFLRGFEGRDFRNAHGLAGTIISIADNNIIIKDKDGKENTAAVTDKTIIKNGRDDINLSDLKQDDQIVIMGSPDENGVVNASLIRIFNSNNAN